VPLVAPAHEGALASASRPAAAAARIALVAAVADNGVIGRAGRLPWHLPDDLRHFKGVTLGKPVLMGRHTFESIGRALPGRRNLVLTHGSGAGEAGVEYVADLTAALERTHGAAEICVIGGAQLYALTLPLCTRMYLTRVHAQVEGDVLFPAVDWNEWEQIARSEHPADARHAYAMSFVELARIRQRA
jgi:dihydrofolate reductase